MPDNNYQLMTKRDLLNTVLTSSYKFDIETGKIFGQTGKRIIPYPNDEGHLFVRIYWKGKRKACAVHRLIWMAATRSSIPEGFEVHHRDNDTSHNPFYNLMCVHKMDHDKFHKEHFEENDVPF
jgi:hypothetical protein